MVTRKQLSACKDCQDRKVGCQGSCERYKVLDEFYKGLRKERIQRNDIVSFEKDSVLKTIRRH